MKAFGLSDTGKKRTKNQDSFGIDLENKIFILADGMGGHYGGEIASQTAVKDLNDYCKNYISGDLPIREYILKSIRETNKKIFSFNKNMGTTLELIILESSKCWIGHVGDSRIYRFREGTLEILTTDHTKVRELVDSGFLDPEAAKYYPFQHVITRAVGIEPDIIPDIYSVNLKSDDILIMCSDGLTGDMAKKIVTEEEIRDTIKNNSNIEDCCKILIDMANNKGGPDNITVVMVHIEKKDIS